MLCHDAIQQAAGLYIIIEPLRCRTKANRVRRIVGFQHFTMPCTRRLPSCPVYQKSHDHQARALAAYKTPSCHKKEPQA
jgi:hypothetical protein